MTLLREVNYNVDENPMGTLGFSFVEFTSFNEREIITLFESLGFYCVGIDSDKSRYAFNQGEINFFVTSKKEGFGADFFNCHGPSISAMGFNVHEKDRALSHIEQCGVKKIDDSTLEWPFSAIWGIGDSHLYLVDSDEYKALFSGYNQQKKSTKSPLVGLTHIDHLTHNVFRGNMDKWSSFYSRVFNFREIRYFDIRGQSTGLLSRAMTSPCGHIRIPINESTDEQSQIEEYLRDYNGEGIQHIALHSDNIYSTVEQLLRNGVEFMSVPDTYYDMLEQRLPGHGEDVDRLHKYRILIDGHIENGEYCLLLQIFTKPVIGPIFFEIIQRKGDQGFGEGNFQALFESIERDQIARGVIKV